MVEPIETFVFENIQPFNRWSKSLKWVFISAEVNTSIVYLTCKLTSNEYYCQWKYHVYSLPPQVIYPNAIIFEMK